MPPIEEASSRASDARPDPAPDGRGSLVGCLRRLGAAVRNCLGRGGRRALEEEAERHAATTRQLRAAVTEAERARAEVEAAHTRLRDAIDTISEGFMLLDPQFRYVLWNRRYEEMYPESADLFAPGRSFEEVLRIGIARGQYPDAIGRTEEWIAERLDRLRGPESSHEQRLPSGRWVLIHERRTAEGGVVGVRTDITELKAREADLLLGRDRAEAASRAKSEFLANMSHELRTPLNAIIGFSEIIREEMLGPIGSEPYRDYASDINEAGLHLLRVVNDVLDLARIEAGHLDIALAPVDVGALAREVRRLLAGAAEQARVELVVETAADLAPAIADAGRLRQVLLNLVANALKFTPAGGRVTVSARSTVGDHDRVILEVADTGIGIAASDIAVALAPFGQLEPALTRRYGGVGLGLPLSARLVKAMGGVLSLASAPGQGTTVTVALPAATLGAPTPPRG